MNEETKVLLDLDFEGLISSLQFLSRQYEANTAELKKMADAGEKGSKKFVELQQTQKVLRQEIAGVEKQIQSEIKMQNANEGSLVAMRAELQRLNKQYDSMSGFQRMSEQGTALQQKIQALSNEIQGLEENTGRWQRNVGNYKSALKGLKDGFEGAGLSSRGLDKSMKLLSANPWMTVIGVLVSILVKLRDRMKDNAKVTASLGNAMSSLQPVFDWFSKAISKLADIFSNVLDWAIEKTIEALGWLGRQLQKIGKLFGKDWGQGLIDYSVSMQGVTKATEEAATATDTLDTSMHNVKDTLEKTRDALEDFLATYKKVVEESKKESLADVLQKAGGTKTAQEVVAEMQSEIDKIPTAIQGINTAIDDSNLQGPSAFEKFAADFTNNAKDIESVSSSLQSSFGSLSSIYQQMAKDESKSEAEREAAAKKAKAWAALQIAANSGTAIAKGIVDAMDAGPWPANMAALASTMAAVLAAIAQAKALASQQYETGGVIGGYHGASLGHDNTAISARRGEMVINAQQQRQLFELANGGGLGGGMYSALAQALANMPAPVLDFKEFTNFTNRVASMDETAKLR